jgi:hypothetical protein
LDKSINYQGMIVEKLNLRKLGKVNETHDEDHSFPSLSDAGFESEEEEVCVDDECEIPGNTKDYKDQPGYVGVGEGYEEGEEGEKEEEEESVEKAHEFGNDDSELSESINKLIEEAKKRKVSESSDLNFLKFLNKSQVDSYYSLSDSEQDDVKLHINERSYFTQKDVLVMIAESLSTKNETLEERVIRLMPEKMKKTWSEINESSKKSFLSQARLYPEDVLKTEQQIEHFWGTRNIKKNELTTKKLLTESLIQEDKLSENEMSLIMERFKNI